MKKKFFSIRKEEISKDSDSVSAGTDKESMDELQDLLEQRHGGKKKKIIVIVVACIVIVVTAFGIFFFYTKNKNSSASTTTQETQSGGVSVTQGANLVTATGTTSIGIIEEDFTPDYIDTDLDIEEVYVSSGDEIKEGDAVLKLTDDSVEAARKELTEAATTADLAYRAEVITCEQSKITAQYDYDSSVLAKNQAQDVYDAAVASLQNDIDDAQEALDDAQKDLQEYQDALNNDTYEDDYQAAAKKATYEEDLALLQTMVSENSLNWSAVTGSSGSASSASKTGTAGASATSSEALQKAQTLYALVVTDKTDYEQAQDSYDEAVEKAKEQVKTLTAQMDSLQAALTDAQTAYTEGVISAKAAYDTTLATADMAQDTYDTAIDKAEEELESAESDKNDADDNLTEFEDLIGDGKFYATSSGTVLMVRAESGSTLTGDSMVFAYSNPDEITVAASVDQSDIAELTVGESAVVSIDGYGTYSGTITTINPATSSSSRTSVTYTVTVTLDGDVSALTSNLTASVIFGMEGSEQ